MSDSVQQLVQSIDALSGTPVTAHPAVLDDVHRGLVSELDRLAGDVSGPPRVLATSASGRS